MVSIALSYNYSLIDTMNQAKPLRTYYSLLQEGNNYISILTYFTKEEHMIPMTLFIHFLSIMLKAFVGLYGYSGEHVPPKYGDFEAQRHWMEMTSNLNVSQWYTNSTENPSDYWPMDYPPMSGYHSYLCSFLFNYLLPDSMKLISSYGFESPMHKILMRLTALLSDILTYHLGVYLLMSYLYIANSKTHYHKYYILSFILLLSPLLIIIDHGHFQFNNVMHGLYLIAVYFLFKKQFILAIIFYSMCINFKQMGMYYAIPFPLFVLKELLSHWVSIPVFITKLTQYAVATIGSIAIIWSPWIITGKTKDVLQRIFPLWRGIFEDKVATFWCSLNIIVKLNKINQEILLKCSLVLTCFSAIIPAYAIMSHNRSSKHIVKIGFFIVALGFYLFSFHVHEKTIIVPFLAYLLCYYDIKEILSSFTLVGMFSMYPMLIRENQIVTYYSLTVFGYVMSCLIIRMMQVITAIEMKRGEIKLGLLERIWIIADWIAIVFIIGYHVCEKIIPPPLNYPWFYPMINALFSFIYFGSYFLYANYFILKSIRKTKPKLI